MLIKQFTFIVVICLLMPLTAYSQDVQHCLKVEMADREYTDGRVNSILNTCDHEVYLFWCHDGVGDGVCGEKKFYRSARKMKPKERYFNQYRVPSNATVHTGACMGRRKHVVFDAVGPGYQCKDVGMSKTKKYKRISVQCGEEQKDFKWRLLKKSTGSVLIKMIYKNKKNGTETHRMSLGDFKDIQAGKNKNLKNYVCSQKNDEQNLFDKNYQLLKKKVKEHLPSQNPEPNKSCADRSPYSPECKKLPPRQTGPDRG